VWWAVITDQSGEERGIRTDDAGRTWSEVNPPASPDRLIGFFLADSTAWFGRYRTLDGGKSWHRMPFLPTQCMQPQFIDSSNGWCLQNPAVHGPEGQNLYRTSDNGASWHIVEMRVNGGATLDIASTCDKRVRFLSTDEVWIGTDCRDPQYSLNVSTDGGIQWQPRRIPPPDPECQIISADAPISQDSRRVLIVECENGRHGVSISKDKGMTWSTQPIPQYLGRSHALIDADHWAFSDGSALISTADAGGRWITRALPPELREITKAPRQDNRSDVALHFVSPDVGIIIDWHGRTLLWKTLDGGITWSSINIASFRADRVR
jgi:photosystem II stability/assembly factor-like uncharacterized protein